MSFALRGAPAGNAIVLGSQTMRAPRPTASPAATQHAKASQCRRGFSLAETLVVLAIVGLLAGMAAPYTNSPQLQADAAARKLLTLLMSAERLAVARQHDVVVSFDLSGHTIRTLEDRDGNGRVDAGERVVWRSLGDGSLFVHPPAGVSASAASPVTGAGLTTIDGMPSVIFRRSGAASADAEIYIAAGSLSRRMYRAVTVTRATGRPVWHRWLGGRWAESSL